MANTTWNPSDKAANITLSGGNLIATATSIAIGNVRAVDKQITGKFYWEATCGTWLGNSSSVGFASPSYSLTGSTNVAAFGSCVVQRAGNIYVDGVSAAISVGTITSGSVVCMAIDIGARLVWFRVGAAGNWNNNVANNPATGVGGVAIGLGGGIPAYPLADFQASGDQITANFGDSAFTGAVPAGFTSGFTAGANPPVNELLTQIAAEEWGFGTSDLQMTQIAVEEWATVQTVTPQLVLTQVAVEEWATVTVVPVSVGAPIITIIG